MLLPRHEVPRRQFRFCSHPDVLSDLFFTTFAVTLASLPIVAVQVATEKALEAKEKKGGKFSKVSPDPEVELTEVTPLGLEAVL